MLDLTSKSICNAIFQPCTSSQWLLWLVWLVANQQFKKSSILQMRTNGIELEAQYNRYLVNGIEKIQVSDFYKITR
jgi:midasin (ATPase involved in ribosome maturation)